MIEFVGKQPATAATPGEQREELMFNQAAIFLPCLLLTGALKNRL